MLSREKKDVSQVIVRVKLISCTNADEWEVVDDEIGKMVVNSVVMRIRK